MITDQILDYLKSDTLNAELSVSAEDIQKALGILPGSTTSAALSALVKGNQYVHRLHAKPYRYWYDDKVINFYSGCDTLTGVNPNFGSRSWNGKVPEAVRRILGRRSNVLPFDVVRERLIIYFGYTPEKAKQGLSNMLTRDPVTAIRSVDAQGVSYIRLLEVKRPSGQKDIVKEELPVEQHEKPTWLKSAEPRVSKTEVVLPLESQERPPVEPQRRPEIQQGAKTRMVSLAVENGTLTVSFPEARNLYDQLRELFS